ITLTTNVTGEALRNTGGGADLFGDMDALEAAVRSGDDAGMAAGLTALDDNLSHTVALRADLGGRMQYVDLAKQRLADRLLDAQQRRSDLQDADLSEAVLEYQSAQNAQQATLAMAGRMDSPSLLDYLR